jgi:uncharacterized protein (TIGR02453 family)
VCCRLGELSFFYMAARLKRTTTQGGIEPFDGFPEQGFRFLHQLKQHNDREWFRERKADYERYVQQPMEALVLALGRECLRRAIPLHPKEKNPVMRVYRDIRFSKNKQPFKTHVSAELRRSFTGSECLLYIHLSPQESFLAAGVWQPERPLLHAWRETIVQEPERFQKMLSALAKKRLELGREQTLSTMPRGFQNYAQEPVGPWLKLTSFVVSRRLERSQCTNLDLLKAAVEFAADARPLFEFGWRVEESFARPAALV